MSDVENGLFQCKRQLEVLGSSRGTITEQRSYLLQASQTFVYLMGASVDGSYSHPFFGSADTDEGYAKRLRAVVQCTLQDFAQEMRLRGHTVKFVKEHSQSPGPQTPTGEEFKPTSKTRDEYIQEVQLRMARNRGRELPGLFNPDIVSNLFYDQAKPWQQIILATLGRLIEATELAISMYSKRSLTLRPLTASWPSLCGLTSNPSRHSCYQKPRRSWSLT